MEFGFYLPNNGPTAQPDALAETSYIDFNDRAHFELMTREKTLRKAHANSDQCAFCGMMTPVATEYMRWPTL